MHYFHSFFALHVIMKEKKKRGRTEGRKEGKNHERQKEIQNNIYSLSNIGKV